jgi:hypothetical protein
MACAIQRRVGGAAGVVLQFGVSPAMPAGLGPPCLRAGWRARRAIELLCPGQGIGGELTWNLAARGGLLSRLWPRCARHGQARPWRETFRTAAGRRLVTSLCSHGVQHTLTGRRCTC